jgi:hypothetical protein
MRGESMSQEKTEDSGKTRCKRCLKPKLDWQVYCGSACSALAESKKPYPYMEEEIAEVYGRIAELQSEISDVLAVSEFKSAHLESAQIRIMELELALAPPKPEPVYKLSWMCVQCQHSHADRAKFELIGPGVLVSKKCDLCHGEFDDENIDHVRWRES